MYSYDDRIRAVRLYIQYDKSAAAVIRELGYPERKTLRYWCEEYLRDNGLKKRFVRSPKYNGAQKEAAVMELCTKDEVFLLCVERDVLEKAAEVIKKEEGVSFGSLTNRDKAVVIDALRNRYRLKTPLSVLQLSKSSYFYQEAAMAAPDKYADVREKIRQAFDESSNRYGYRRIHAALKNEMFYGRSWQDVSIDEFIKILDDYMHWYAEERIKISLGGISPIQCRRQLGLTV